MDIIKHEPDNDKILTLLGTIINVYAGYGGKDNFRNFQIAVFANKLSNYINYNIF